MKFIAYYDSPLGKITLAGDKAGFAGCGSRARNTARTLSRQAARIKSGVAPICSQKSSAPRAKHSAILRR
ncbi:hypothetical protein [Campylobacter sp.]|uniref:hypothetical protein n=1 Tax=Campylobacter sp. TaxID=205 RepID=UPI0025EF0E80|nr:hypothetical protein [Campylobacter sp.]